MKIRIEIDSGIAEEEIIIRSRVLDERVRSIQEVIQEAAERNKKMVFYKGETTYYLPLAEILFFETDGNAIHAGIQIDHLKYENDLCHDPFRICFLCGAVSEHT